MHGLKISDRSTVRVFIAVSVLMLAGATALRASMPSPFAPRVDVRWAATIDDGQRAALEQQFSLRNGVRRDGETWEYDLVDLSTASVAALVAHPGVADTHNIDRAIGRVAPDAPAGTIRLPERRAAALVHSILFDWFLLFWASSIVVSGVWLAADADARD
jgi:hypothetical protein